MLNRLFLPLFLFVIVYSTSAQTWKARVVTDRWGVTHAIGVGEDSEQLKLQAQAAFHAAGYAEAGQRLMQMVLARLSVQGRLAEVFGNSFLDHDKRMRTLGLYLHAQQVTPALPDSVRILLDMYASGVNYFVSEHRAEVSTVESVLGIPFDAWTAADAVACFYRISEYFDRGWTNEVQALRKFETMLATMTREEAIAQLEAANRQVDDAAAIVSQDEYNRYETEYQKLLSGIAPTSGGASLKKGAADEPWEPPKMSHNWVVGPAKSSTGYPILESDPQITVQSPATWYETHISGGPFNVRGISMPGTPVMLLGFNEHVAWGLTALGSDNADLFQEELRPGTRNEYKWKGGWETMTERTEVIKVKGARDVTINVMATRHGPVVNDLVTGVRAGEIFALHWLVLEEDATTITGLMKMMSARNWPEFAEGVSLYQSPGVHLIYADVKKTIAYYTMARIPLRVHNAGIPYRGGDGDEEWLGVVPFDEMPRMLNPVAGYISTANNAPVGSWYPYAVGGGLGDNARSWRLKELMEETDIFSPDDFLNVHRDMVEPIARDFVRYAIMAVDENPDAEADAKAAADSLRTWDYTQNTTWSVYRLTSTIGVVIKRTLRGTPLESRYLGSDAGLIQLFRDLEAYETTQGGLIPDPDIRAWLIAQLAEVYRRSGIADPGTRPLIVQHSMPWQDNLEKFGSLNRSFDQQSGPLTCGVVATIWSQLGNSYSQIVDLSLVDSSLSVLPPGNSEIPTSAHFGDMIPLWEQGGMHPAPLTWTAVAPYEENREEWFFAEVSVGAENAAPDAFRITNVWPNPGSGIFTVSCSGVTSDAVDLIVRDILGREISRSRPAVRPGSTVLQWTPPSGLPAGMYHVTVHDGKTRATVKVMYQP
ncbi:MAG: penicillin acylase family protein [Bacteroidetes bacterium]|nr:penicillin acylase family protein [Bacteroidota bacterium]